MPRPATTRTRGRPAKLSREQILNCALKMMQRAPGRKITMTGVARALDTAPMSLYTHVKHRDDLLDGISDIVLGQMTLDIDCDAPWQKQVRDWLNTVHAHLSQYPQIVEILGQSSHVPGAWLRVHAPLIRSLKMAGLQSTVLAQCSQWVAQQVIGSLLLGFASTERRNAPSELEAGLNELVPEDRELFTELLPHLRPELDVFPFTVDRTIAALEQLVKT